MHEDENVKVRGQGGRLRDGSENEKLKARIAELETKEGVVKTLDADLVQGLLTEQDRMKVDTLVAETETRGIAGELDIRKRG